jgi:hypothetical protein
MVDPGARAFWMRHLHRWHWISAAMCLVGMILFAITGITLNHAGSIEASPQVTARESQLPDDVLAALGGERSGPLPAEVSRWIAANMAVAVDGRAVEWSKQEAYVSLPRAGGDAWLTIDRDTGGIEYELTDRGWISYLNDLHKGRNAGPAWSLFIDIFAGACLVFCITGLFLLQFHASRRPSTWPMVGLGVVVPVVLLLLFVH